PRWARPPRLLTGGCEAGSPVSMSSPRRNPAHRPHPELPLLTNRSTEPAPLRTGVLLASLVAALIVILGALAPTGAQAAPAFGYGDQRPAMFQDERWKQLPLKHARRLVDWDTQRHPAKVAALDEWMTAARAAS